LKGYARAVLNTEKGVENLLSAKSPRIGKMRVGISRWQSQSDYLAQKDLQGNRKVYVKFPTGTQRQELLNYFKNLGDIQGIDLKTDPMTNKGRNFAYILFSTEEEAEKAVGLHQDPSTGRVYKCEMSVRPHLVRRFPGKPEEGLQSSFTKPNPSLEKHNLGESFLPKLTGNDLNAPQHAPSKFPVTFHGALGRGGSLSRHYYPHSQKAGRFGSLGNLSRSASPYPLSEGNPASREYSPITRELINKNHFDESNIRLNITLGNDRSSKNNLPEGSGARQY
jgi:RNA recognition motif-containing protein